VQSIASINITGPITASGASGAGNVNIATVGNNAPIAINGAASGTIFGLNVTLSTNGSGNITQTGGSIVAGTLTLSSSTGSFGTLALPILSDASNVQVLSGGTSNGFISNVGIANFRPLTLMPSTVGTQLNVQGGSNNVNLTTVITGGGPIVVNTGVANNIVEI